MFSLFVPQTPPSSTLFPYTTLFRSAGRTDSTDFPVVNALYDTNRGGAYDAFVTKLQWHPDFFFSPVSPITADVGGSGSSNVRVNSFDDFNALVDLNATGQPAGMTASFD